MVKTLSIAILAILFAGNGWSSTYKTAFPAAQNPICEGSPCKWTGGQSAGGNHWGNVQTTLGFAFGAGQPSEFGDPTAILTGTWGPDQTVTAVAVGDTNETGCCREAELRLRTTITSNSITGYEVYCSVTAGSGAQYCSIARWAGGSGLYCNIEDLPHPAIHLITGDIFTATITGTNPVDITGTITRNGTVVAKVHASDDGSNKGNGTACVTHTPFTSGNPGIGFYAFQGFTHFDYFGFSSITATDGAASTIPEAPTGLAVTVH
jgi:hypothetical protein